MELVDGAWCVSRCVSTPLVNGQPASTGSAAWGIARTVRFDVEDQVLADGARVIDGVTFTVANSAAASTWRTTIGTGLQFTAAATSTQWVTAGGGQSATNLRSTWANLVPDYDPTRRYMLQLLLDSSNANQASERTCVGVIRETDIPTGANRALSGTFHGHNGTALMAGAIAANSAGTGSVDYTAVPCVLCWVSSPSSPSAAGSYYAPTVAGVWAAQTAFRTLSWTQTTGVPSAIAADAYTDPLAEVFLSFPTGNNSATFSAVVRALRVLRD